MNKPKKPSTTSKAVTMTKKTSTDNTFPIVGIGASAGGLEALEQFFAPTPQDCGIAFVVIQHLDPTRKGLLVELLQRCTSLPVVQITDALTVKPNNIYVIPPNFDLSIMNGRLYLLKPTAPRGLRLPIDFFFRSLADERQDRSVAVVLSGMGSDGTMGLRSIKEKNGAVFVQTPETAKFNAMPLSAIDAGLADVVAPANELAAKIISYVGGILEPKLTTSLLEPRGHNHNGIDKILVLLRIGTGHDFSLYKKSTIFRRIERRMALHQITTLDNYAQYLRETPEECELLFNDLLIGVTNFFRDEPLWEQLKTDIIPKLLANHPEGGKLRAWVPACSTGEEAYSLAIIFREALDLVASPFHYSLQIFATDLDNTAIEQAREGVYLDTIATHVSEARLMRFFTKENGKYRIAKEIRDMVIFAPQNIVKDPPFIKLDLLSCRNLLIYLEQDVQKKLFPMFHYSLAPGGVLVLGNSETADRSHLFTQAPGNCRVFFRRETDIQPSLITFPDTYVIPNHKPKEKRNTSRGPSKAPESLETLIESLLMKRFAPAAVVTTSKGDIVFINGKTGKYLEPASGRANLNLFSMLRGGLKNPLYESFLRAVRSQEEVELKKQKVTDDDTFMVNVTILPQDRQDALSGMVLVVFTEVQVISSTIEAITTIDPSNSHSLEVIKLAKELQEARENLQITREEMQISQEELTAINEELQSTNEELQSTNEELTTSKEEMQSMNEELQTVNHEHSCKIDELSLASDDMENLLNSTDIATLFLDEKLKVRRFTNKTTSIIKLIPSDCGRPITDLVTVLNYPTLASDSEEVLRTLIAVEHQVPTQDNRWFSVRIMPYRTQDNHIDGVVITFSDITKSKAIESTLLETQEILKSYLAEQNKELITANDVESVLKKTQALLETHPTVQPDGRNRNQIAVVAPKESAN